MPVRCALGCEESGVHRFPNPIKFSEQFRAWVHIMGDNLEKPEHYVKYKNMRVCPIHFTEKDKNRNNRLNALAVPSLHLPAWCTLPQPEDDNVALTATSINTSIIIKGKNDQQSNKIPANSHIGYKKGNVRTDINIESLATEGKIVINKVSASVVATKAPKTVVSNGVSSLFIPEVAAIEEISTGDEINVPIRTDVVIEHNYCSKSGERMNFSETRVPPLKNAKIMTTTREVKNLRSEISRLRKRCLYYKTRLENARKFSNNKAFEQITKPMTESGKIFTLMNFRESKKKPKGRRFTVEEKVLALSIFKESSKCYSLLQKYFPLPSEKSLINMDSNFKKE